MTQASNIWPIMLSRKHNLFTFCISLLLIILGSCDSEDTPDCFQTNGDSITRTVSLPPFTRVRIDNDINIEITQGDVQEIIVETKDNLWSDLAFFIEENTFVARNNGNCTLFRDEKQTTVKLTTPNLDFIKNNSIGEVRSNGTLTFPRLRLESITTPGLEDINKTGDFILDINIENLVVVANGNSDFFLSGNSRNSNIIFSDEFPLLEAGNLIIQDLIIRHVGAAPMIVNPQNSIRGAIRATGDVISLNKPPVIEVSELFTGQLIFED